ncbi:hypothetical protein JMG10_33995 [Nostoc ellipsosporum NOK]|nr:hypothetical protein [Nostoc ellipsosporum NOK]
MKRLLSLLSLLITITVAGQARDLDFHLGEKSLIINRKVMPGEWPLRSITGVMGTASRINDGYNRTHSYDDLGIVLYEPKNHDDENYAGRISEIQIYFQPMEKNKNTPEHVFTGSFSIDELVLTSGSDLETIRGQLKGFDETPGYDGSSVRMSRGPYYLFFHFKNDGTLGRLSAGLVRKKL